MRVRCKVLPVTGLRRKRENAAWAREEMFRGGVRIFFGHDGEFWRSTPHSRFADGAGRVLQSHQLHSWHSVPFRLGPAYQETDAGGRFALRRTETE